MSQLKNSQMKLRLSLNLSETELDLVVKAETFRELGLCVFGTKKYGEELGLKFKDLVRGKLTVRDFVSVMQRNNIEDQNIINVITRTIENSYE